jgi:hypothetical protein
MNTNNFETLVQNLQNNKMKLFQNKEELANIIKSFDFPVPIEANVPLVHEPMYSFIKLILISLIKTKKKRENT